MRQDGYYDKNDLCFLQHLGIVSQSRYYNNFNAKFKPEDQAVKSVKSSQKNLSKNKRHHVSNAKNSVDHK